LLIASAVIFSFRFTPTVALLAIGLFITALIRQYRIS
jgi:hypothetical protein